MRGGTTAELKSRLPLKGLADQLNLYVCEVLYGEHTKGWNSRRRMPVQIQPQIPEGVMPLTNIRLTDVIGCRALDIRGAGFVLCRYEME